MATRATGYPCVWAFNTHPRHTKRQNGEDLSGERWQNSVMTHLTPFKIGNMARSKYFKHATVYLLEQC